MPHVAGHDHQFHAPTPEGSSTLLAELNVCRKKHRKLLRRYVGALKSNGAFADARDEYLGSTAVKFAVATTTNDKRPAHKRASLEELHSIVAELDLCKPIPETVKAFTMPKSSGGVRVICDFGPAYRTAHSLVVNVLKPHFQPAAFQYDRRGSAGLRRAVLDLVALIKQGYCFVEHLDAKDFFGFFGYAKLPPELPLPTAVTEHVVLGRHAKIKITGKVTHPYMGNNNNILKKKASQGLLQGAASSPLVGAIIVSRLNWIAPADVALISFVDDFYLVAKSASALKDAADALRVAFETLSGGHFKLRTKGTARHVRDGVPILGHCVTAQAGKISILLTSMNATIADERFEELETRAEIFVSQYMKDKSAASRVLAVDAVARLSGSACAWAEAFKLCEDVPDELKVVEYKAAALIQKCGIPAAEIAVKAKMLGGWKWGMYPNDY